MRNLKIDEERWKEGLGGSACCRQGLRCPELVLGRQL